jgi:hypothetical protein
MHGQKSKKCMNDINAKKSAIKEDHLIYLLPYSSIMWSVLSKRGSSKMSTSLKNSIQADSSVSWPTLK